MQNPDRLSPAICIGIWWLSVKYWPDSYFQQQTHKQLFSLTRQHFSLWLVVISNYPHSFPGFSFIPPFLWLLLTGGTLGLVVLCPVKTMALLMAQTTSPSVQHSKFKAQEKNKYTIAILWYKEDLHPGTFNISTCIIQ